MRICDADKLIGDIVFKLQNDPVSGDGRNKLKWLMRRIEECSVEVPDDMVKGQKDK